MATAMTDPEQIRRFLDRSDPPMLGVVGTVRADGSPHVVPVWYRYDGQRVHVWTDSKRVWVRNLVRDRRVAFSVHEDAPPQAAVLIWGSAEIETGDQPGIDREIRRITRRYVDEAGVEAYVARWSILRTIVHIRPDKVVAWASAG